MHGGPRCASYSGMLSRCSYFAANFATHETFPLFLPMANIPPFVSDTFSGSISNNGSKRTRSRRLQRTSRNTQNAEWNVLISMLHFLRYIIPWLINFKSPRISAANGMFRVRPPAHRSHTHLLILFCYSSESFPAHIMNLGAAQPAKLARIPVGRRSPGV